MPLYTRCIKAPKRESDGMRISVMSRHTLDDGVTPDPEITSDMYEKWWKELGPPPKLIGPYRRKEISWNNFERCFRTYLVLPGPELLLRYLIRHAEISPITILCVEETPEQCHRRLIAEICKEIAPFLEIHIE